MLNAKQIMAVVIAVLGVLMISTSQLTDLFGPTLAKSIVSTAALMNSILGSVLAVITGQAADIRSVLSMPGVERVTVNAMANKTLASIAVDPNQDKIAPTAAAEAAVERIATE